VIFFPQAFESPSIHAEYRTSDCIKKPLRRLESRPQVPC
jgi:hypothetical protein